MNTSSCRVEPIELTTGISTGTEFAERSADQPLSLTSTDQPVALTRNDRPPRTARDDKCLAILHAGLDTEKQGAGIVVGHQSKHPTNTERSVVLSSESILDRQRPVVSNDDPTSLVLNLSKNIRHDRDVVAVEECVQQPDILMLDDVIDVDAPIDLSRGHKSSRTAMSNGADSARNNGVMNSSSLLNVPDRKSLKRLQDELRNEETKLVLLKKIRQSQAIQRLMHGDALLGKVPPALLSSAPVRTSRQPGPPPLIRGGAQAPQMTLSSNRVEHHVTEMPRLHTQSSAAFSIQHSSSHGPPPLIMATRPQAPVVTTASRPVPSVLPPGALNQSPAVSVHGYHPAQVHPPAPPPVPEQSAAQRQAAAKMALRRQLEKTLLQIPPPKPPPPEMNFIPNINSNSEFVMLVGLEEAVKCIVDSDLHSRGGEATAATTSGELKFIFTPFECIQCQTDYTPVWKRDRPGSKSVICERCVTTNQKKALKQEHTNRLKGAFVRALQQEQEIEQSLQAGAGTNTPPPSTLSQQQQHSSASKTSSDTARHYQGLSSHHSTPNLSSVVTDSSAAALASLAMPAAAAAAFNASRLMFPGYQRSPLSSGITSSLSSAELQRQFLLDMMPRRPPMDGQVIWRM